MQKRKGRRHTGIFNEPFSKAEKKTEQKLYIGIISEACYVSRDNVFRRLLACLLACRDKYVKQRCENVIT